MNSSFDPSEKFAVRNGSPLRIFEDQATCPEKEVLLYPFFPKKPSGNGCVIVFPGGGYEHISFEKEGTAIAAALNAKGLKAFVLDYLSALTGRETILRTAVRAVQFVRLHSADLGIDQGQITVMGFSAGGHLALMTAQHSAEVRTGEDAVSDVSGKPDALILCYPVVTFLDPYTHKGSRLHFLGAEQAGDPSLRERYSAEKHVGPDHPPAFLWHCEADASVPVENSLMLRDAFARAGVDHQLQVYSGGGHGLGLAPGYEKINGWFDEAVRWLTKRNTLQNTK